MTYPDSTERKYALHEFAGVLNTYLQGLCGRREFIFICRYYYADRVSDIAKMPDVSTNTVILRCMLSLTD